MELIFANEDSQSMLTMKIALKYLIEGYPFKIMSMKSEHANYNIQESVSYPQEILHSELKSASIVRKSVFYSNFCF